MRIDLAGERLQPRLRQQPLLLFELVLVPRVVPDLERQYHGEQGRRVERHVNHEMRMRPRRLQRENQHPFRNVVQRLAEKFGEENHRQKKEMKSAAPVIPLLEKTPQIEVEKRRKSPDVLGIGRAIAQ